MVRAATIVSMTDAAPGHPTADHPRIAAPRPFVDRRTTYRRAADRVAHEETRLLARALDILAAGGAPETRLANLLDLLADTVGADRAAVVADGPIRRVAVTADDAADTGPARALGAWLDAAAPRSRARRAAETAASIAVVLRSTPRGPARTDARSADAPAYALLPIPSAGDVILGFAFGSPVAGDELERRLPPALARHAAVALALVTDALTTERALAELRAGESERERFVSTVAHELRTPLTGLGGYLDLLLAGAVDDPAVEREFLERGRSIVDSMAGLVGDLLDLARLESGSLALEIGRFSVAEAIGAVRAGLHPIAVERGCELLVTPPPRLRAATGDRRRVEQILTNLAANALKFGGGEGRPIELAGWFAGDVAVIVVRDEGPGIEPDDRAHIFERFYRVSGHERITGTGLGLPIARDLAAAMGGALDVASVPGAGSSFALVLPGPAGASATDETVASAMVATLASETDRLRQARILRDAAGWTVEPPATTVTAPATSAASASADGRRDRDRDRSRGATSVPVTVAGVVGGAVRGASRP